MKKNDLILIGVITVLALSAFGGISLYSADSTKEAEAVVRVDGQEQGRYPLDKDRIVKIELADGSYNILEIKDGKADMTEATCPDKICVDHRPVNKRGESLVCLPNQVVVEIENGVGSEVDSSTR